MALSNPIGFPPTNQLINFKVKSTFCALIVSPLSFISIKKLTEESNEKCKALFSILIYQSFSGTIALTCPKLTAGPKQVIGILIKISLENHLIHLFVCRVNGKYKLLSEFPYFLESWIFLYTPIPERITNGDVVINEENQIKRHRYYSKITDSKTHTT